ncbi:RNA polymerase II transcription factor B subunit 2 [Delitschia confertaspora ATCC 74209]|uniref:RNA polymerase II transcription factor B subunit 2 n=1 Tax=Delitschia confertaspora ATCC 74209 TaxID=1513339 RepID=A0A9P4JME0_9PLEO|nr:RNA polymerase II transcription factor B subunit 2 [Delitschia confertaspora ATCC 74209]
MSASASQALAYLEELPLTVHKKLYQQPSTVLAIFRCMLPHLAKTIVMAMLYMTGPLPIADLDAWVREDARSEKDKAVSNLESLHIINLEQESPKQYTYRLNAGFARSLRQALTGGGSHASFGVPPSQPDPERVDLAFLDEYARKRWETILYYMVASTSGLANAESLGSGVNDGTKTLLRNGEFVRVIHGKAHITEKGFSFVLQEVNSQVWSLLLIYLKHAEQLQMSEVDILSFIFMLGSLELGQDYSTETLSPTQQKMLEDLSALGIVYCSSKSSTRFYPTRLATTLTSEAGALSTVEPVIANALDAPSQGSSGKGYIIVETNYRLYAYTSSHLQIAVLNLFVKLTSRFPNLVAGKLTKESVRRANGLGISASQIIDYLATHAHPQMQKNNPVLPPTVMDQIRLWEYEGERIQTTDGYLMKDFRDEIEYNEIRAYTESLGILVWRNDHKRFLFLDRLEQVKLYMENKKNRGRSQASK